MDVNNCSDVAAVIAAAEAAVDEVGDVKVT